MLPLAEVSAEALKSWLEVVLYIAGVIAAVAVAWNYLKGNSNSTEIVNQPLEIKAHAGSVSREELKQVHGRIERERREINEEIKRVELAAERRAEKFEAKIDENTTITAEMRGMVGQMNQTLHANTQALTNFLRDRAGK